MLSGRVGALGLGGEMVGGGWGRLCLRDGRTIGILLGGLAGGLKGRGSRPLAAGGCGACAGLSAEAPLLPPPSLHLSLWWPSYDKNMCQFSGTSVKFRRREVSSL